MPEIASNTQGILVIPKPSTGRHSHLLQHGDIVQLLYVPKKSAKQLRLSEPNQLWNLNKGNRISPKCQ